MDKSYKKPLLLITFGVILFAAFNNLNYVANFLKSCIGLLAPILSGLLLAFVLSVPVRGLAKRLRRKLTKVLCYFHFAVGAFYHEYSQNLYGVRLSQHSRFDKGNICIIVWVTLYWRMSAFPILLQLHSNLQQYTFANP